MATETLKIVITADNKGALTSLQQTAAETDKFKMSLGDLNVRLSLLKERLNQATEPARITKLGSEIKLVTAQIESQKSAFAALGAETEKAASGMAGGLQKAFGGLRMIANILPGIGLAGMFGLAFDGIMQLAGGFGQLSEAEKATKKSTDDIFTSIGKEASEVNVLVEQYRNTNLSLQQRGSILKQLNSIAPEYFNGLKAENTTYADLKTNLDAYTASLANQIKAKIRGVQLEKDMTELLKKQDEQKKTIAIQEDFAMKNKTGRAAEGSSVLTKEISLLQKKIDLEEKEIAGLTKVKSLETKGGGVVASRYNLDDLANAPHLKHKLEGFLLPDKTEAAKELQQYLNDILPTLERSRKKDVLMAMGGASAVEELQARGGGKSNALTQYDEATGKKAKALEDFNLALKDTEQIMGVVGPQIDNLFAAMQNGADLGTVLGDMFKKLAEDIAKAAIKALLFQIILSAVSGGGDVPAGAGGGFGEIFFKLLGLGSGKAKGGVSTGPQGGHIELLHGTEAILTPAQMSGLVRNSMNAGAVTSMGNNSQQQGGQQGEFLLRGNDLVLALQRSNVALNLRRGS